MTFTRYVRFSTLALFVAAIFTSACSSNSTSTPATPTATAPVGLNLTGAWTGTLKTAGSNDQNTVTWAAGQSGTSSTGTFGVLVTNGTTKQNVNGTLAGVVTGTQVVWTLTFPVGAFTAMGSPNCSLTGSGTSSAATTSSIEASLNLTFAPACIGTVADKATEVDQLSLKK